MTAPLQGKTIGLLTASASRLNGGVFEAVVAHADLIRSLGATAHVFALEDEHTQADRGRFGETPVTACAITGPRQIGYSPALDRALAASSIDALHLHGIWMYPSASGATWARHTGKPYFVSPHGMLDPWITARGRWKKAIARLGYEKGSWRAATALHALTEREARDISREAGRGDSVIIPNAGPAAAAPSGPRAPVVLYIGRIHTKKNLLPLVAAWHDMAAQGEHPAGARLVIAGWGDEETVKALKTAIAAGPGQVEFLGPVYGDTKQALLDSARFMVLPSLSEGLPMAVLEAWAAGTPMIMSRECNLDEGYDAGAAIECGFDAASIRSALARGWALDDAAWHAMQTGALRLASDRFSLPAVTRRWGEIYQAAIAGAGR